MSAPPDGIASDPKNYAECCVLVRLSADSSVKRGRRQLQRGAPIQRVGLRHRAAPHESLWQALEGTGPPDRAPVPGNQVVVPRPYFARGGSVTAANLRTPSAPPCGAERAGMADRSVRRPPSLR